MATLKSVQDQIAALKAKERELKKAEKEKVKKAQVAQNLKAGQLVRKHKTAIYKCAALDKEIRESLAKIFGDELPAIENPTGLDSFKPNAAE